MQLNLTIYDLCICVHTSAMYTCEYVPKRNTRNLIIRKNTDHFCNHFMDMIFLSILSARKCPRCLALSRAKHDRSSTDLLRCLYINMWSYVRFPSGPSCARSPALQESQEMFHTCPETPASPHSAASAGNVGFQAMLVNAVIPQRDTPGNGTEMRKETVKQEWKSTERKQFYHCHEGPLYCPWRVE